MPKTLRLITPLVSALLIVTMSPISYGEDSDADVTRIKKAVYGAIPGWIPGLPPCDAMQRRRALEPSCVLLTTRKAESYISVEIADESNRPVAGYIWVNRFNTLTPFCGKTPAPVPVAAGRPVLIYVSGGPKFPYACDAGLATFGTVTATFMSGDDR